MKSWYNVVELIVKAHKYFGSPKNCNICRENACTLCHYLRSYVQVHTIDQQQHFFFQLHTNACLYKCNYAIFLFVFWTMISMQEQSHPIHHHHWNIWAYNILYELKLRGEMDWHMRWQAFSSFTNKYTSVNDTQFKRRISLTIVKSLKWFFFFRRKMRICFACTLWWGRKMFVFQTIENTVPCTMESVNAQGLIMIFRIAQRGTDSAIKPHSCKSPLWNLCHMWDIFL